MTRVLVIGDNRVMARALSLRLEEAGYDAVDLAWTPRQALSALSAGPPDLIVVSDQLAGSPAFPLARELAMLSDSPMLMVTGDSVALQHSVPAGASLEGPFPLIRLDDALEALRKAA